MQKKRKTTFNRFMNLFVCLLQCLVLVVIDKKPNCNAPGEECLDRFISGDGTVFYFHGKSDGHISLVTDPNLLINARFICLRSAGQTRHHAWIQAIRVLFGSETFSLEAKQAATWDEEFDHLEFSYNGNYIVVLEGHLSSWKSPESDITVGRTSDKNSALVTLPDIAEISVNMVPVSREDDRIHNYRIVGGEDKYQTSLLLFEDSYSCVFSPAVASDQRDPFLIDFGTLESRLHQRSLNSSGRKIVCRR